MVLVLALQRVCLLAGAPLLRRLSPAQCWRAQQAQKPAPVSSGPAAPAAVGGSWAWPVLSPWLPSVSRACRVLPPVSREPRGARGVPSALACAGWRPAAAHHLLLPALRAVWQQLPSPQRTCGDKVAAPADRRTASAGVRTPCVPPPQATSHAAQRRSEPASPVPPWFNLANPYVLRRMACPVVGDGRRAYRGIGRRGCIADWVCTCLCAV